MVSSQATEIANQSNQITELNHRVDDLEQIVQLVLLPISVLIGALAIGGVLGIVFSIRDQRRVSQLHELTVSGEVASQRRADQSFAAFFESSQKTLTLVNDTLGLAKQATTQSAQTMQLKANASLQRIEDRAEDLVLRIAELGDFDAIMDMAESRASVESIDRELAALRGYLDLQDIAIPPYSRFVHGIALYLTDHTSDALETLRHGTQDTALSELHRFSLYWAAKISTVVGRYDQAARTASEAKELAQDVERYELQRLAAQIDFFRGASTHQTQLDRRFAADARRRDLGDAGSPAGPTVRDSPAIRLRLVLEILSQLQTDAAELEGLTQRDQKQNPNVEMACLRGDILTWVAYDATDLISQVGAMETTPATDDAERADDQSTAGDHETTEVTPDSGPITLSDLTASVTSDAISKLLELESSQLRRWAHQQAQTIYEPHLIGDGSSEPGGFSLAFGHAESDYALGNKRDATEYRDLERRANEELGTGHREHRRRVEVAQVYLICKGRDLKHARDRLAGGRAPEDAHRSAEGPHGDTSATDSGDGHSTTRLDGGNRSPGPQGGGRTTAAAAPNQFEPAREETEALEGAYTRVVDELNALRDPTVTVFSHLQRRNLDQDAFREEVRAFHAQAVDYSPSLTRASRVDSEARTAR